VLQVPGPSGMSVAIVDARGIYGAVIVSGVNGEIAAGRISVPEAAGVVLLQNEIPVEVNLAVARKARMGGAQVVWNAAPARGAQEALLANVDVLVVNRVEAADMVGPGDAAAQAAALAALGPRAVVVSCGAAGVVVFHQGATLVLPAHPVEVVSTHGAGDMLVGAMAMRLAEGATLAEAVDFGQAAAALLVSRPVEERDRISRARVEEFCAAQAGSR